MDTRIEFRLLGTIDFDRCVELQERLLRDLVQAREPRIEVLLCEHPRRITIGRGGSRADVRLTSEQLKRKQLAVQWVARGGGTLLHAPGQLAVYPIAPLDDLGWSLGAFARGFQFAVAETIRQLRVTAREYPSALGVWGRGGMLAAFGVSVRRWTTQFGAYVNVNPAMTDFNYIDAAPHVAGEKRVMSSLVSERRQAGRMPKVRSLLIEQLAAAWGVENYHLHTGHPYLATRVNQPREPARFH